MRTIKATCDHCGKEIEPRKDVVTDATIRITFQPRISVPELARLSGLAAEEGQTFDDFVVLILKERAAGRGSNGISLAGSMTKSA